MPDDVLEVAEHSLQATLTVFLVCGVGAWLTRQGTLSSEVNKGLTNLVAFVFSPCLIFTHVGPSIEPHTLLEWWPVPASCLLYISLGVLFGVLMAGKPIKVLMVLGRRDFFLCRCYPPNRWWSYVGLETKQNTSRPKLLGPAPAEGLAFAPRERPASQAGGFSTT